MVRPPFRTATGPRWPASRCGPSPSRFVCALPPDEPNLHVRWRVGRERRICDDKAIHQHPTFTNVAERSRLGDSGL